MFRSLIKFVLMTCAAFFAAPASAFSLAGPIMPYQSALNPGGGYLGGKSPQGRDEEYRWNIPVVTYGFDQPFFNHFGTNGINTIQESFRILNDLPPVSQITDQVLSNYFFQSEEVNLQAATLRVIDLKSYALSAIMGHIGLTEPETYVWSLRSRWVADGPVTNFTVIVRNYDPITRDPSRVINGTTYSYSVAGSSVTPVPLFSSTAASAITGSGRTPFGTGFHGHSFWGLTYDDVGGIRELYRTNNFNMERVLPTLTLRSSSTATGGSVWSGPFSAVNGALTGGVWDGSYVSSGTNQAGGATNDVAITNLFTGVDIALRGGLDKISFVRVNFDSILAQGFIGITNTFVDRFKLAQAGVIISQTVARQLLEPDILFRAGDLGLENDFPVLGRDFTVAQINNYDISGAGGDPAGNPVINNGPGILVPGNEIYFSNILPFFFNQFLPGSNVGPDESAETGYPNGYFGVFGTFDGSAIDAIYPVFMNLQLGDLEQLVRDSQLQP